MSGRAKFELANALDYLSEEAKAIPLYEEAIPLGLTEEYQAYARLQLGSSLRNEGRLDEAISVLRDAERRYPNMPPVSMFLALALHSYGQSDEALKLALRAMLHHLNSDDIERYRPALGNYIEEIGHTHMLSASTSGTLNTIQRLDASQIHIRPLREDEQPPIAMLLSADPSESIVTGYLKRGTVWIAEAGASVVGVYVLLETRPETVELVNVAVREDIQGQGLGKQLVYHAVETARQSGFRTVELGTGNSSVHQLRLYQKCGFRIVGMDADFLVRHYDEPIYEGGIQCRDMIRLRQDL